MICAMAHSNIALVKYWGKRDRGLLNLPAVGSISLTLDSMLTHTTVLDAPRFSLVLNGHKSDPKPRTERVLSLLTGQSRPPLAVESRNDFPTAAGLASSASGLAALSLGLATYVGSELDSRMLSTVARQGSGSAARSLFGGFVEWYKGESSDGSDSFAECIGDPGHWPIRVAVAVLKQGPKSISSGDGMVHSQQTSPFYSSWVENHPVDIAAMRHAIKNKDFELLAETTEASCMAMHAVMMSAQPALVYWLPETLGLIHEVRAKRAQGWPVCFTIDAGPQMKVVYEASAREKVLTWLQSRAEVLQVIDNGLGRGAWIEDQR